jgi:hypothetical protein
MFTFKNYEKEKGLAAVCASDGCYIKLNKIDCGYITDNGWRGDGTYRISLQLIDDGNTCGFKWVTLKYQGSNVRECKNFLRENFKAICDKGLFLRAD